MNLKDEEIKELISELKQAAEIYYQGSTEIMTDDEYDSKIEYLETLVEQGELELTEELNELLYESVSAGSVPDGTVVSHDYPMLSLAKAKNFDELKRYHERLVSNGAKGFTLQMKLDGLALSAKYVSGKLVQLATRGDGVKGELLNHLINHKEVEILGLPYEIDHNEDFELRGELYITDAQFERINKARSKLTGEAFSNSRNAVTGIVKGSIKGMGYNAEITFTAYSAYHNGEQIEIDSINDNEQISKVKEITKNEVDRLSSDKLKLNSCEIKSIKFSELEKAVEIFGKLREQFSIPTDGVVIKPVNEIEMLNKMGYTSKFPIAYIAFKYPGAKSITTVEEITVSVGKTGRLTPQARVVPVEVDGVTVTNVTCHNYSWLNEMEIREGATVAITRANDVIPAIDVVINKGPNSAIKAPSCCPECGELLSGDGTDYPKTLTCENLECPSRLLYYMKSIVGRNFLYIEGLGDVALEALVDQGILTSVVDLFKLTEDVLAKVPTGKTSTGNVRMLGAGNAKNIMESIERAKVNTDSNKLLASLNFEGMGPNTAKRLIAHFGGIEKVLKCDPKDLMQVDQVGQVLVSSFERHRVRALAEFNELVELGFKINDPTEQNRKTKGSFSVSGSVEGFANRNEFVEYMENLGWEFHRSPKKTTDVLFADPNGSSSKIKKARENGTKIINNLNDL